MPRSLQSEEKAHCGAPAATACFATLESKDEEQSGALPTVFEPAALMTESASPGTMLHYICPDDRYPTGLAGKKQRAVVDGASSMLQQCAGTLKLWPLAGSGG